MIFLLNHFGPFGPGASALITIILGYALLLTAAAMLLRRRIQAYAATRVGRIDPTTRVVLTVLTGVALGVFVSLSSVGAGALGVTALILLYPEIPTSQIVGSDIAHAVPLTLVAGFGHWLIGSVDFGTLGLLLIGSIPGIILGSFIAPRLPDHWLRPFAGDRPRLCRRAAVVLRRIVSKSEKACQNRFIFRYPEDDMKFSPSVIEAIGHTPLINLKRASELTGCTILGKAEFMNPGGSVKDRAALAIIQDAIASGALRTGGAIVEGTAGNTGIGLGMVASALGFRTVIVIPETQTQEKKDMLRLVGAELIEVPAVPYANPNNYVKYSGPTC